MATHTAVQLSKASVAKPSDNLSVVEVPKPSPAQGQVLVRLTLRPCNPADVFSIQGVYPGFTPKAFPAVPGLEGTGVVAELGPGASKFQVGQRVVGAPFRSVQQGAGTWQQYILAAEEELVAVPDAVSDDAAAQWWINPVTVFGMLEVLAVPQGEYLLQTAAGSVLGRQLIQLAKHRGIKTINVVRRQALADELRELGADEVIVSEDGAGLADAVKDLTGGRGAYAAVECIGGDIFSAVVSAVRDNGTVIMYGAMSGVVSSFFIPDVLFRNVNIQGFWLVPWTDRLPEEERQRVFAAVMGLLADKVITPYAGEPSACQRFPLESIVEAIAVARSAGRGGKVLIEG